VEGIFLDMGVTPTWTPAWTTAGVCSQAGWGPPLYQYSFYTQLSGGWAAQLFTPPPNFSGETCLQPSWPSHLNQKQFDGSDEDSELEKQLWTECSGHSEAGPSSPCTAQGFVSW
jgi:hypothetical protein